MGKRKSEMSQQEIQDDIFQKKVFRRVGKAISEYGLVKAGDRIVVGVSGGKDSLALLELLALRRKYKLIDFDLYAVHINVKELPYMVDHDFLDAFCKELEVPIIYRDINVDFDRPSKKPACFRCSWHRRKTLFQITQELGCNKLALGHHMDDALETLMMNMLYHGSICSMPASLSMFDGALELIRPLILLKDEEMKNYCRIRNFVLEKENCPHEDATRRKSSGDILGQLEELNPHVRSNLFRAMSNIHHEYLPQKIVK